MTADLASTALGLQMEAVRHSAQIAILKKSHEMEMSVVSLLADAAKIQPPAPEGMGRVVDKSA